MKVTITGSYVGAWRLDMGLTRKELANILGWELDKLVAYELGTSVPLVTEAWALAGVLKVDVFDLWDFDIEE